VWIGRSEAVDGTTESTEDKWRALLVHIDGDLGASMTKS
jgi:hypothetical protein